MFFFFEWTGEHRDLHVLTHSFPTRRSSDLNITQRFAQQLAFEGELHVEWRPLSALPTGEALMRLRDANLTVLNLVSAVEEHRADGSDDDTAGVGELVRLDAKVNLLLELVQRLVDRKSTRLNSSH